MTIRLLNYGGEEKTIELDMDRVARIDMRVVTGDEILTVNYKDLKVETFDSYPDERLKDFDDGGYAVYFPEKNINLLLNEGWLNRHNSYVWLYYFNKSF